MSDTKEKTIVLKPGEVWTPSGGEQPDIDLVLPAGFNPVSQQLDRPVCTCGVDKVGSGIHSDWCDLKKREGNGE